MGAGTKRVPPLPGGERGRGAVAEPAGVPLPSWPFVPRAPPAPPGPYPVEDCSGCSAPRQNMRGCCLEAAASLRRWLPVKNMSSPSPRVLRQLLFSPPPLSFFSLPSRKTLFYAFLSRAPPAPPGGTRVRVLFPTLGRGKWGRPATLCSRGRSAGGQRREGSKPSAPPPPCFAQSWTLFCPFHPSKQGDGTQKYKSFEAGKRTHPRPSPP